MDVSLLDHRRQRLLGGSPRLQEAWKVRALPEFGDAQLDRARAGFPVALPVAVALVASIGAALAVPSTAQRLRLQLHQPLRGKADHLAQEARIRALFQKLAKSDLVIGHRGDPSG